MADIRGDRGRRQYGVGVVVMSEPQAGNVRAQSDVAVAGFEAGNRALDPDHPPAQDPRDTGVFGARAIILGVVAFVAAPLVWGTLGILLGISASRGRPRQKLGLAAIAVGVLGLVVGTVLHHAHPFGYG
jgi:hypothetical protein